MAADLLALGKIFSLVNVFLAMASAGLSAAIVGILSDRRNVTRLKAGYFLSVESVVFGWKMLFAAFTVYAFQYLATTAYILGMYSAPASIVLLAMYALEMAYMVLLFAGILASYRLMRKYAG